MRNVCLALAALILLPALARTQALPDNPAPAPPPVPVTSQTDRTWARMEQLSDGQPIVVDTTSGLLVHCRFAGATDTALYCDPPGAPLGQAGYHFERAVVVSVRVTHPEQNWHPVLLGAMVVTGTVFGLAFSRNVDATGAAAGGLLVAGLVGAIGYPIAKLHDAIADHGFSFQPRAFRFGDAGPHGLALRELFH